MFNTVFEQPNDDLCCGNLQLVVAVEVAAVLGATLQNRTWPEAGCCQEQATTSQRYTFSHNTCWLAVLVRCMARVFAATDGHPTALAKAGTLFLPT